MLRYAQLALSFSLLLTLIFVAPMQAQSIETCTPQRIAQANTENHVLGSAAWSPDGQYVAVNYMAVNEFGSFAFEMGVKVFTAPFLDLVTVVALPLNASNYSAIIWSPDATHFAISNDSSTLMVDVETGNVTTLHDPDPEQFITQTVWSDDGTQLATVSHNRELWSPRIPLGEIVRIWDIDDETIVTTYGDNLLQARIANLDNDWYIAFRSQTENHVSVIQLADGIAMFERKNVYLTDLAASDHLRLAVTQFLPDIEADDAQAVLEIWNVTAQEQEFELSGRPNSIAASALISGTDLLVARIAILESVVHDLSTGFSLSFEQPRVFPSPNAALIASVEQGIGGSATITATGDIFITNSLNGETVAAFPGDPVSTLDAEWSPNSQFLAVSGYSGELSIWSLEGC